MESFENVRAGLVCQNKLRKLYCIICMYFFLLSHYQSQQYFTEFNLAKGQGCEISKSNKPKHSHLPKNYTFKITSYYGTILTYVQWVDAPCQTTCHTTNNSFYLVNLLSSDTLFHKSVLAIIPNRC